MESKSVTLISSKHDLGANVTSEHIKAKPKLGKNQKFSINLIDSTSKNHVVTSTASEKVDESKLAKSFPWLTEFVAMCRAEIGVCNITTLENLMTVYLRYIESSVVECYGKPNRAAKLKRCMNDSLVLFHMLYSDIKKPLEHSSYLERMSELLAYYIDMEIKASRRAKESLPKIASKLTSSLFLFLDNSIDHILDAILKTKNMTKNFSELCFFIFKRVLKVGPGRPVYEMTYVRYILVFKMWKRVVKGAEERRKVTKLAASRLVPPPQFREKSKSGLLCGVLPKIPKSRPDITMFLMQAKFCAKDKSKAFLRVVADLKQQCVLGSGLAADLDRPLFFGEDDNSPNNSNSDDQEDTSGSSILMNDIWSSITLEAGLRDHLRLAEVTMTKPKKNTNLKSNLRKKNKSKTDISVSDDKLKKVKKKVQKVSSIGENEVENQCNAELKEKANMPTAKLPVLNSNEVSESCTQTAEEDHDKDPVKETTPLIPIEDIKVESDQSDDVCFVGVIQQGQSNMVCETGPDAEMLNVGGEVEIRNDIGSPVKQERSETANNLITPSPSNIFLYEQPPPATNWAPTRAQNYCNTVCNFINGYLDQTNTELDQRVMFDVVLGEPLQNESRDMFPLGSGNGLDQLPPGEGFRSMNLDESSPSTIEDNTASAGGRVTLASEAEVDQHAPIGPEHHEKMDHKIEPFKEQSRFTEKTTEPNVVTNSTAVNLGSDTTISLHDRTLWSDHSVFVSQHKCRSSLCITEMVVQPSIPVPSPPKVDSTSRCSCVQCNANYDALITNFKKLTAYKNSKLNAANTCSKKVVGPKDDEKAAATEEEAVQPGKNSSRHDKDSSQHSSLPLKKRKALQPTAATATTLSKKKAIEISYPSTPMMSIAVALETGIQPVPASKRLSTAVTLVDYTTSSSCVPHYSYTTAVNSASSTVTGGPIHPYNGGTGIATQGGQPQAIMYPPPVTCETKPPSTTDIVPTTAFQRAFKTPAQLKEGITVVQPTDLNAAQDLINFAQNSHNFYLSPTSNYSTIRKTNKRPRTCKTKSQRHTSKKKKS